jgi:predicted ester cyclase
MSDIETYRQTMERLIEEIWNQQNLDVVSEVFTEDAVMHHGGSGDCGGHDMIGIPAFRDGYMRPTQAAFPDIQHRVLDLLFDGDKVVMRFQGEGTHMGEYLGFAPTDKTLRYEGLVIFRMEGALIAEVWVISNMARVLAAMQDQSEA